jgi:hypothetical protein
MTDMKKEADQTLPDAYWLSRESTLTLYVKGRERACADPWLGHGEICGPSRLLGPRKGEPIVLPLSQPLLDEIEKRLALPSPAPILDERGAPLPDLRRQLAEHARHFSEKRYLETDRHRETVTHLLNEAYRDLNKAASAGALSAGANEARFKCAEALRALEDPRNPSEPYAIGRAAAEAIRSAVHSLDKEQRPGTSAVQSYPLDVYAARFKCARALEHAEKSNRQITRPVEAPRPRRSRNQDLERER